MESTSLNDEMNEIVSNIKGIADVLNQKASNTEIRENDPFISKIESSTNLADLDRIIKTLSINGMTFELNDNNRLPLSNKFKELVEKFILSEILIISSEGVSNKIPSLKEKMRKIAIPHLKGDSLSQKRISVWSDKCENCFDVVKSLLSLKTFSLEDFKNIIKITNVMENSKSSIIKRDDIPQITQGYTIEIEGDSFIYKCYNQEYASKKEFADTFVKNVFNDNVDKGKNESLIGKRYQQLINADKHFNHINEQTTLKGLLTCAQQHAASWAYEIREYFIETVKKIAQEKITKEIEQAITQDDIQTIKKLQKDVKAFKQENTIVIFDAEIEKKLEQKTQELKNKELAAQQLTDDAAYAQQTPYMTKQQKRDKQRSVRPKTKVQPVKKPTAKKQDPAFEEFTKNYITCLNILSQYKTQIEQKCFVIKIGEKFVCILNNLNEIVDSYQKIKVERISDKEVKISLSINGNLFRWEKKYDKMCKQQKHHNIKCEIIKEYLISLAYACKMTQNKDGSTSLAQEEWNEIMQNSASPQKVLEFILRRQQSRFFEIIFNIYTMYHSDEKANKLFSAYKYKNGYLTIIMSKLNFSLL